MSPMPRFRLIVFVVIVGSFSAGCDTIGGITHVKRDVPFPDSSCIMKAVQSVPGVSNVEYKTESGGLPLTMHGLEKPDEIHRYIYRYSGLRGNFYYRLNYKRVADYSHTYIDLNRAPPQKEIDTIRPVMFQIEKAIETECDAKGFMSGMVERCSGVKCE